MTRHIAIVIRPVGGRSRKDDALEVFFFFGMNFQSMDFLVGEFWSKFFTLTQNLPCCTGFQATPRPASVYPGQLHSWNPEILGHQLFPILRENNQQANKTKQKVRFFIQHPLLRTIIFTQEELEKVYPTIFNCKTSSSASVTPLLPGGKGAKYTNFHIPPSSLQSQASWTVFVPQEKIKTTTTATIKQQKKSKTKTEFCTQCRPEPHY